MTEGGFLFGHFKRQLKFSSDTPGSQGAEHLTPALTAPGWDRVPHEGRLDCPARTMGVPKMMAPFKLSCGAGKNMTATQAMVLQQILAATRIFCLKGLQNKYFENFKIYMFYYMFL